MINLITAFDLQNVAEDDPAGGASVLVEGDDSMHAEEGLFDVIDLV